MGSLHGIEKGSTPATAKNSFLHVPIMFYTEGLGGVDMAEVMIPSLAIEQFLKDLGEASYRHGLAINDQGLVFVMEPEDYERRYHLNEGDYLTFN